MYLKLFEAVPARRGAGAGRDLRLCDEKGVQSAVRRYPELSNKLTCSVAEDLGLARSALPSIAMPRYPQNGTLPTAR